MAEDRLFYLSSADVAKVCADIDRCDACQLCDKVALILAHNSTRQAPPDTAEVCPARFYALVTDNLDLGQPNTIEFIFD